MFFWQNMFENGMNQHKTTERILKDKLKTVTYNMTIDIFNKVTLFLIPFNHYRIFGAGLDEAEQFT